MGTRVEKNGYTAELTDDLDVVYRNPQGRKLKNVPEPLSGTPGLGRLLTTWTQLKKQREVCREQARVWAQAGTRVPRAVADADPLWREALESEAVDLADELGDGGLWARTYTGFDGRTQTLLLPEQLVPHRDRLMREDEWEPDGCFSTGIPDTSDGKLPFPERVIAAHPGWEDLTAQKLVALRERTSGWRFVFKSDVDVILQELEESAPALLVTLLDEMADLALGKGEQPTAAAWFGRARTAERTQARKVDREWLVGRYLAYAEGKALSATVLRAWARELAVKGAATAASLTDFRRVVIRRVRASGELYPQLPTDVRKIARAAGLEPEREVATLLGEVFAAGAVSLSDDKFWAECFKGSAMDLLGDHAPEAVRQVLKLRPSRYGGNAGLWRELLERTGALALLTGETDGLPTGEAAAWLSACVASNSKHTGPWRVMHEIAERIAPRLAADGVPVEFHYDTFDRRTDRRTPLDLIDLLLEHGAPVADPPELLGPSELYHLHLDRRPKLEHLRADARFAHELRARVRADLEMTTRSQATNSWYQPQSTKGWDQIPTLFDNEIGHEEIRAWSTRERAKLRAGVDFEELILLLGRYAHVGVATDLLLKDAEAAAEFAAVDVMPLLMAELPDTVSREEVEELVGRLEPYHVDADGVRGVNRGPILETLPQLGEPMHSLAARALVMAANCRDGLERLVRRLTPDETGPTTAPAAETDEPDHPDIRMSRRLVRLAEHGTTVWGGDLAQPSTALDNLPRDKSFRITHACAAPIALCAVSSKVGDRAGRQLLAYAAHPVVIGEPGRWRLGRCEVPEDRTDITLPPPSKVFRTESSVTVVLGGGKSHRMLWEYAPDGSFAEEGPLAPAGLKLTRAHVLEPVRPSSWFGRFAELYREHGPAPARPELAETFAQRLGLTPAEATVLLMAHVPCAPHQLEDEEGYLSRHPRADLEPWKIRWKDAEEAVGALRSTLDPRLVTTLYDKLLPDDPEQLWTTGPDVDRAAAWWVRELGAPLPVPETVLPLAAKETLPPQGERALHRVHTRDARAWWPHLRLPALIGRVATGAHCLDTHRSPLLGEPQVLALPRTAAWLAYRTPAGDPLRPAVGAAIARLREEAAVPGARTLFSLQSNYLMGPPPSTEGIAAHPAVTEEEDPVYDIRHLRVDQAALKGADDPLLDTLDAYLDSVLPSQWLPTSSGLPTLADLRLLLSDDFAALGEHLATDGDRSPGWEQNPACSVPHLVEECATAYGLSEDAAALYLMLLALPDPTDRNVKAWTGWKTPRFKAAETELGASGRVLRAVRARAGRSLFLPGAWQKRKPPRLPIEVAKLGLLPLAREHRSTTHLASVPSTPLPTLFTRAWEGRGA
ncbi:hypothetical protein ABZ070_08440 [Streptomyces sp. NPDC006283]|uniref:hypothetical protein n=1 Tax=Streptomyces sp. NPDC006283 TaxID=3156741 RepID=UPI0033A7BF3E